MFKKGILFFILLSLIGCQNTVKKTETPTLESLGLIEEDISIGTTYPLKGKITYSSSLTEKAPAVILVHGSGPNDMNEKVGDTKVFEDLAYGLASKGIIVLRYDKVTYTYGKEIASSPEYANFTYQEETINDVGFAKEVLTSFKYTDPDNIYILGHSMGGMLAPEIDRQFSFKGMIIMAGSPKSMIDIIINQNKALITDQSPEALKKQVDEAVLMLESIKAMSDDEAKAFNLQGITGYYLKSFESINQLQLLVETTKPVIIIQGTEDFQVQAKDDYVEFETALKDHTNVTFKLYDGLNHAFITSNGKKNLTEYSQGKHVEQIVIDDIASFINKKE